jgi:transcriptional regulator with XRE-family HTH domain
MLASQRNKPRFIYETLYQTILFVASVKRGVAIKNLLWYVLSVKWLVHGRHEQFKRKEDGKMAYKNESMINTIELGRAIKRRREELKLSLRDVADVTQVSASTLSRIENGTGKPDADNIARLTNWLEMPVDRVMKNRQPEEVEAVVYYPHEATPEIVEAHLRADKNLSPETAKALSELFRVAYSQFSKPGK